MIQFKCPHCAHPFHVDDSYAGKHAKCSCGEQITIPGASIPAPPVSAQHVQDDAEALALSALSAQPPAAAQRQVKSPSAATVPSEPQDSFKGEERLVEWFVPHAANKLPEEAITSRYPALHVIAQIIRIITVIEIVLMWLGFFGMWFTTIGSKAEQNMWVLLLAIWLLALVFTSIVVWAFGFAVAELILLAIDVSNDTRINRFLIEAILRHERGTKSTG